MKICLRSYKMKNIELRLFLSAVVLMIIAVASVQGQGKALIIKKADGSEIITDADRNEVGSGAVMIKTVPAAEGYVFPDRVRAKKRYPRAEKIITGVFSSRQSENKAVGAEPVSGKPVFASDPDLDQVNAETKENQITLAWITREAEFFHDPYLDCGSFTSRLWVKDLPTLAGIGPCPECYIKTAHAPDFIIKECGGLDLATAGALLDNPSFLVWAEQNLPIKKAIFLTGQKLLIYPKEEMNQDALLELAHETAMAYRRKTWRVIEVLVKKSEADLENLSSY